MKKTMLPLLLTSVMAGTLVIASPAMAAPSDAWLHIKVDDSEGKHERVRVNVPLDLAEKVLPAIQVNKMHSGKLRIDREKWNHNHVDIDPHALMEAVQNTKDGVFVTVESKDESVRVAKEGGYLVVKVTHPGRDKDKGDKAENVDVRVPLDVMQALLGSNRDELDIVAAIRALATHHDGTLVSVTDRSQTVRIWVDLKSSAD